MTTALGFVARLRRFAAAHKALSALVALAGTGAFALGMYWFQPWKLFVDERVDEAPLVAGAPTPAPTAAAPVNEPRSTVSAGPLTLSQGAFRSLEHPTSGTAKLVRLADGRRVVRFENLQTSNGPDLVVILSTTPATSDSWTAYGKDRPLSLGKLKGNLGSQNYEVPADADLARFQSVVVWCRRFGVAFGSAPLTMRLP